MSMDKTAIEQIQQSQTASVLAESISKLTQQYEKGGIPVLALPDTFHKLDLEGYMPQKQRFTGLFKTSVIEDFAKYSEDHATIHSAGYVSEEQMAAKIIFDLGNAETPLHAGHSAILALKKTSAYESLEGKNGSRTAQKDMAEWFEDMLDYILFVDQKGEKMNPISVITAVRNVTIEALKNIGSSVNNYDAEMSSVEKIGLKDASEMPHFVIFKCVPYHGLSEREFKLRLSITTSDKPVFTLRIVNFEMQVEEMSAEFVDVLVKAFSGNTVDPGFIRGSFSTK